MKNEVLDAVVTDIMSLGFYAAVGPLKVFVHMSKMPADMNGEQGGGFDGNAWVSADEEVKIEEKCGVRLRILGCTADDGQFTAVGTMNDEFLGMICSRQDHQEQEDRKEVYEECKRDGV